MTLEVVAILLTLVVHILGAIVLVMVLLDGETIDWRGTLWPRDDDGPGPSFEPPEPDPTPSGSGVPLPDASPAAVRLREPGRIREGYPKPARRPAHTPERTPPREPAER
ncbi:hypothetical protein DSM104299_02431 [Baekduia alba]|uniref:hypothetical protein n=1 Tax=Baekduia alba TaxID=2997333 RepID=UPI0023409838|nr:hypothetical protein [Baekduia alba]WCB93715.1 hypothetical protein DSM104299_02431 [Baekduia alba]